MSYTPQHIHTPLSSNRFVTALRNYARDEDAQDILLEVAILLTDDRPQVCVCVDVWADGIMDDEHSWTHLLSNPPQPDTHTPQTKTQQACTALLAAGIAPHLLSLMREYLPVASLQVIDHVASLRARHRKACCNACPQDLLDKPPVSRRLNT